LLKLLLVPAVKSRAAVAVSLRSASPEGLPQAPFTQVALPTLKRYIPGMASRTYGRWSCPANR